MDNLVGKTLGNYQVVEQLGRGGMANVYKAYHPGLAIYRAIKVIRPEFGNASDFRERFQREAQAVAAMRHPNIVQIHDFGEADGLYYMVMEFVPGTDLKALLQKRGQIRPFQDALKILEQVGSALDYAHKRNLIHRDIKPANIMLDQEGKQAILMDFGIAKLVQSEHQMTQTGVGIGTPAYMAPEQARGQRDVGPTADLYALGIVLYEMLTGQLPFSADTPLAVMLKVVNDPLPLPRYISPDIPDVLQGVILKATAKNPADRYQTAEALLDGFRQALQGLNTAQLPNVADAATLLDHPAVPVSSAPASAASTVAAAPRTQVQPAPTTQQAIPASAPALTHPTATPKKGASKLLWLVPVLLLLCLGLAWGAWSAVSGLLKQANPGVATQPASSGETGSADTSNSLVIQGSTQPDQTSKHTFDLQASQTIYFDNGDYTGYPTFRLLDPNQNEIFSYYASNGEPVLLDQSGTYTLEVSSSDQAVDYNAKIWILKPAVLAESEPIAFGKLYSGKTSTPGQRASYQLSLQAGQTIFFDLRDSKEYAYYRLNGADLLNKLFDVYANDSDPVLVEKAGTYTLEIVPSGDKTIEYSFVVWNVEPAQVLGETLSVGKLVTGKLDTPGQIARYTIAGSTGQGLFLDVQTTGDGYANYSLLAPDGFTQVFDVYADDSGLVTLPQDGDYTLTVDPQGDDTLDYSLVMWQPDPAGLDGGSIALDKQVSGQTKQPGEFITYKLSATAGQLVKLDWGNWDAYGDIVLYSPDGQEVFRAYASDSEAVTLATTGEYRLVIDPGGSDKGAFDFVLTSGSGY